METSTKVLLGLLRVLAGWHLLYEGIVKLMQPGWTSASYLESSPARFFQWIAATPWALKTADWMNMCALSVAGLMLVLGLLTRPAGIAGAVLLLLYYAAHPPFFAAAGSYSGPGSFLIVDRNLIEACVLLALATLPPGMLWGLDRLLFVSRRGQGAGETEKVALDRRSIFADLTGVPVLGALAAAIAGARAGAGQPAAAQDRDTFIAGASIRLPAAYAPVRTGNIVSIRDYEQLAPGKMSVTSWEYIAGGAGDGQTVYWNAAAYQRIQLRQKTLVDVRKIDTRIQLLGRERPHPILLSPAASHHFVHPDGERATAKGAGAAGATMIVSTFAHESIENIAKAASKPLWYAPYLLRDRAKCSDNIRRAEAAGYEAICIPVDTAVVGARDRELRSRQKPIRFQQYPVDYYRFPTSLADIEWFRAQTKLPIILKGILDPDDAERAIQLGSAVVFVSNHGGRNLDTVSATIEALPKIVEKVAGRVPVIVDGGIRRGTDILKALALGAAAVSIGRPYLYGLAVKGAEGVSGVINILRNELEMAMASTGCTTIAQINRSVIAGYFDGRSTLT